jgi:TonB family protein
MIHATLAAMPGLRAFSARFALPCALSLLLLPTALAGQTVDNSSLPLPSDPKALLELVATSNRLFSDNMKPWHLKVSYQFVDPDGKITDRGTIEEFWAGSLQSRMTITSSSATLSYTNTPKGLYREGELNQKLALLEFLSKAFTEPIRYSKTALARTDFEFRTRSVGGSELPCFTVNYSGPIPGSIKDPTYCLENNLPVLRIVNFYNEPHQFIRNHIGKFQDRYVSVDITAGVGDKPDLIAHLDQLETLKSVDSANFEPGPYAVLQVPPASAIVMREGILEAMTRYGKLHFASHPQPEYPALAKEAQIYGDVELGATIGTDGRVEQLYVIKGPAMLQEAALDAVWQWRFEPPFTDKGPAKILGVVTVNFPRRNR